MSEQARILIIDDSSAVVEDLTQRLGSHYQLSTAASGEQGVTAAMQQRPDLILLDIGLPTRDGLAVCRQLKSQPATAFIPVIFLTDDASPDRLAQTVAAGGSDYATKPIQTEQLLTRVSVHLRLSRAERELLAKNDQLHRVNEKLVETNAVLRAQTRVDLLTGLLNRSAWEKSARIEHQRSLRKSRRYALLMLDVDLFKSLNDNRGHQHGDMCLRRLAEVIGHCARVSDIVGRYGGEELIMLLPETTASEARLAAERVRDTVWQLALSNPASPHAGRVTVSIGVAEGGPISLERAIMHADAALYTAKREGRNRVCVHGEVAGIDHDAPQLRGAARDDRPSVLVVSPDAQQRRQCIDAVRRAGYEVSDADCIERTVSQVRQREPDAMVLATVPPGQNCLDFVSQLKSSAQTAATPIILLSHSVEQIDPQTALRAGADDYLLQPFKPDELAARIRNMVQMHRRYTALQESERRHATLLSNLSGMAYCCRNDANWTMLFVSVGGYELTGYEPADLIGERAVSFNDLIHPDDRQQVRQNVDAALAEDRPFEVEYRLRTADGKEKWVWERGRGVRDAEGTLLSLEGFITDITDRKRTEIALRLNQFAVDSATSGIFWINDEGRVAYANDAACAALRYDRQQLLKMRIWDFNRKMDREKWPGYWIWFRAVGGGSFEAVHRDRDGVERPVHISANNITAGDQEFAVCIVTDLSELRHTEAQLRLQSAALTATANAVMIIDHGWRVRWVNPAFTHVTGYAAEDVLGRHPRMLRGRRHAPAFYRDIGRTLLAGGVWRGPVTGRRPDGASYTVELTLTPVLDDQAKVTHYVAVMQDVTAHKRAEHAIHQAEVAEAASRAKSQFIAMISHELRTPLNSMIATNDLLLGTQLDPKQRRYAWLAKASGQTMAAMINDMTDLARIESGRLELDEVEFNVRHVAENVTASFASKAERKQLRLEFSVHPQATATVRGDPVRLQQVLLNLVSNAINFTEQGKITVRAGVDSEDDSHIDVRFTVTDTGPGLSEQQQQRLFDLFADDDQRTPAQQRGPGLGLTICKQLVAMMGGRIGVESEPDRGTTFWFTVKLRRQTDAMRVCPRPGDLRRLRVLVLDANELRRAGFTETLRAAAISCAATDEPEQALEMMREAVGGGDPFDLAILAADAADAEQLAAEIQRDRAVADTALLLLADEPLPQAHLRERGFVGQLSGAEQTTQLLQAIAEAITCARAPAEHGVRRAAYLTAAHDDDPRHQITPGVRILLAEDVAINRDAAVEVLASVGYACDAVPDGQAAVIAAASGQYDGVLMDCEMPKLNGYDATRAIRRHEAEHAPLGRRGKPLPIIALTAEAMQGDRERCLAAGMDDYLAKPINPRQLIELIESHLGQPDASPPPPADADLGIEMETTPMTFDLDKLRQTYDPRFVTKLIDRFCDNVAEQIAQLEQSIAGQAHEETARVAHSLKGAAGYVCADRVRELAVELEQLARSEDDRGLGDVLEQLKQQQQLCREAAQQMSEQA